MKKLFFVISFLFFGKNYSQISLSRIQGYWIKYQGEMKDGSDLSDRFTEDSGYTEYRINQNRLCMNSDPVHNINQSCFDFTLINNFIKTSQYSGYIIEKVTNDSLVLCEKIDGLADDKLKRSYFVKQEVIISKFREENKNEKNIIASKLFSPKTNGTIELDLNKAFKNNYSNFELIGNLKIYPGKKRIKTAITSSTQKDSSRIRTVKKVIDGSFEKWNLNGFEDYESVEIPFVLKSEITRTYWGIDVIFFTSDLTEFKRIYGINLQDARKSSDYYKLGLISYEKKNYLEAISYFSESFKFNPENIDALYNMAAIYFESGDKENACKVWLELSVLGQTEGKQLFIEKCN
ncbi:MAG: hypothetical protein J7574_09060 [Flavobacterium sp.]|uniref:tetratricopeptide repeat protein n=1 Tax=Flavobacterium sp. TaxID=239 RepID=UPI001B0F87A3|nr:hypothetical protein [Flavobacterium sp.]MBO9584294.1 hypothetical protein [Flavobacterium sp.]